MTIHASCVALPDPVRPNGWAGVLLRGPSGCGKSDLALRLIDGGARLVSDDRVILSMDGDVVTARAPSTIRGLIEARGIGVLTVETVEYAPVFLVVDPASGDEERIPEPAFETLLERSIPLIATRFDAASAPARIRQVLRAVRLGLFQPTVSRLDGGSEGGSAA